MTTPETVGELAQAVLDVWDRQGRSRQGQGDPDGPLCLVEAANLVGYGHPHPLDVRTYGNPYSLSVARAFADVARIPDREPGSIAGLHDLMADDLARAYVAEIVTAYADTPIGDPS